MHKKESVTATPATFYGPVGTVLLSLIIFILSPVFARMTESIIAQLLGWNAPGAISNRPDISLWLSFLYVLFFGIFTVLLLRLVLRERRISFEQIGLNSPRLKHIGYALAGFTAYFVLYIVTIVIAKALFPELDLEQEQNIGFNTNTIGSGLILVSLSLIVIVPFAEELLFRGFLFHGLKTRLNILPAAAITSFLFAVAHLPGAKEGLLWIGALDTFVLSLVLCYVREKTGSLWPAISIHAIKNSIAFIVLFDVLS